MNLTVTDSCVDIFFFRHLILLDIRIVVYCNGCHLHRVSSNNISLEEKVENRETIPGHGDVKRDATLKQELVMTEVTVVRCKFS